jgi:hypothetical protein
MRQSFIGSSIAFVVAAASILGGVRGFPYSMDNLFGGMTALAGIVAYRSAKKRRLGLKQGSTLPRRIEIWLLVLTCLPPLLHVPGGIDALATNPISCIFVPIWSVIAYVWVQTRKEPKNTATTPSVR